MAASKTQLWIPAGFAHGFYVLSEWAEVIYKVTDFYASEWERTLIWNDPEIGIRDLTETIVRLTVFEGNIVWDTSKPNGQPRRKLDTTFAKEKFSFESRVRFEEGLQKTIEWYVKLGQRDS